jgi:glycosyltransferase involved in cell wall biosynthesis
VANISFVVSSHNNEYEILATYLTIIDAINIITLDNYEIIFIDNASTDRTKLNIDSILNENRNCKYLYESTLGLSRAFAKGVEMCNFEFCLLLPGHDMHSVESIVEICKEVESNKIILGYRISKFKTRPLVKVLTSTIYNLICNTLFKLNLKDVNGLILFPTELLSKTLDPRFGHGHAIMPLVRLSRLGIEIKQIPIRIKLGHKKRKEAKFSWHFPKISNIFSALKTINYLRKNF